MTDDEELQRAVDAARAQLNELEKAHDEQAEAIRKQIDAAERAAKILLDEYNFATERKKELERDCAQLRDQIAELINRQHDMKQRLEPPR